MSSSIDSRADVSPRAHIGSGVSIGPFAIVEEHAVIGDGTTIGGNALIATGARIGKDCRIHHGAVIGHTPQDLKYAGEPTTCEIGERTVVREYATLHRGTGEGGRTVVGSDCFIMAYVHIAHDCVIGDHVILVNAAMMAGHCLLEDWVIVGGLSPIHQFVRIGRHAMVGGGVRVPKDVPPYVLASGDPVSYEGLNSVGLRRRGFGADVVKGLEKAYTLVYRSKLNVSQGLERVKQDPALMAMEEVRNVVEFIGGSKRGIMPGTRGSKREA